MTFEYRLRTGEIVKGFFNSHAKDVKHKIAGVIDIEVLKNGKMREYSRTVRIDEEGNKFFTWNHEKLMFDDFICCTPQEFVDGLKSKDNRMFGDDLSKLLLKYGMGAINVYVNKKADYFTFSKGKKQVEPNWVQYKFVETFLHTPMDNYKLRLEPVSDEDKESYCGIDTYTHDLVGLFQCTELYKITVPSGLGAAVYEGNA